MLAEHSEGTVFQDGMQIGKSHTLIVRRTSGSSIVTKRHGQQIIAQLPETTLLESPVAQQAIRDEVIKALRLEAKSYLPKRLAFLAHKHDVEYEKVRFSHASGRWGSCSTSGTISLNIALMKLPFELIDYVLIHELSHVSEMNHSPKFWNQVQKGDPNYKEHRRMLKDYSPSI